MLNSEISCINNVVGFFIKKIENMKQFIKLGKMLTQAEMKKVIGGNEQEELEDGVVPSRRCACAGASSGFLCSCSKSFSTCMESCSGGHGACASCA